MAEICQLFLVAKYIFMIDTRAGLDERPHFAASRMGLDCLIASSYSKLCINGLT